MPNSPRVQSSQVTTTPGYTVQLTTSTDHLGKGQRTSLKCISWLYGVMIRSWNRSINGTDSYEAVTGIPFCTIDSIFHEQKTLWAAVKSWFQQLDIMTDHFGHLMAHIFNLWDPARAPVVTHSWLVSARSAVSLRMWAWQWRAVCKSLLRAPVLWELHIKTQRALCSRYLKKKSRKTMALRSHEKVSLCQRVEKQPI